jgi:hypothetical protein
MDHVGKVMLGKQRRGGCGPPNQAS